MNIDHTYKTGKDRQQSLLFPLSLDEVVAQDNSVRAIDGYVNMLDVLDLGFNNKTSTKLDGGSAFHPALLLKIYIYGYISKVRSSRALEKEIKRNIEMMWLTQGLTPSHTTIANFRKNNAKSLRKVFKEFVLLCKSLSLVKGDLVALDGDFLRAHASKNQLLMQSTIIKDLDKITLRIDDYLTQLDTIDEQGNKSDLKINATELIAKTTQLKERKEQLNKDLAFLEKENKTQYNKTDPDASLMTKPAHNLMAYNSQIVVDDEHKLIIATDVSSKGNDKAELHKMATQAKEILAAKTLNIVADAGYTSDKELKQCYDDDIEPIVPNLKKQSNKGKFSKDEFVYDEGKDCYICPNNKPLNKAKATKIKDGKVHFIYNTSSKDCKHCLLREQCLSDKADRKSIYRWEYEVMMKDHREKMRTDEAKAILKRRGSIVEHPFGTIKRMLGWDHYLVRGKEKVSGENALIMFSYHFKRVIKILEVARFMAMALAVKTANIDDFLVSFVQYFVFYGLFAVILLSAAYFGGIRRKMFVF